MIPLKIEEMFAFVAQDDNHDEGVMGFQVGNTMMPMVGADMARVNQLRPYADKISQITGKEYRIYKFSQRTDITKEAL